MVLDNDHFHKLIIELERSRDELASMTNEVGKARQVREYNSEMRRNALARAMSPLLPRMSAVAAESVARASDDYEYELRGLADNLAVAEKALAQYEAIKIKWQSAQSLLSLQKSLLGQI